MKTLLSISILALLSGCAASALEPSGSSAAVASAPIAPEPPTVGALDSAFRIEALDAAPSPSHSAHEPAPAHEHHHDAATKPPTTSEPAKPAEADAAVYTCPMHPEVVSKEPGACPKCGMTLVPKKKAGGTP